MFHVDFYLAWIKLAVNGFEVHLGLINTVNSIRRSDEICCIDNYMPKTLLPASYVPCRVSKLWNSQSVDKRVSKRIPVVQKLQDKNHIIGRKLNVLVWNCVEYYKW